MRHSRTRKNNLYPYASRGQGQIQGSGSNPLRNPRTGIIWQKQENEEVKEPRNNPNAHYATPTDGQGTVRIDIDFHIIDNKEQMFKWCKDWLSPIDYATVVFIVALIAIYWLYFD